MLMNQAQRTIGSIAAATAALMILSVLFAGPARAHRVNVFAWVEGDTVFTTSKFSGGKSAQNAVIEVYDDNGKKLLDGRTDKKGEFSFPLPTPRTGLTIVLVAGTGHRNQWVIPLEEIIADTVGPAPPEPVSAAESAASRQPGRETAGSVASPPNTAEIRRIVETVVDHKMRPVIRMLDESRNRQSLADILGGIGYIIGLVGVAAYVSARRKEKHLR